MGSIVTVLGPVDSNTLGPVLAAETLLCGPKPRAAGALKPASEAVFARSAVTMEMLGRLMMGAENADDATLEVSDALSALQSLAGVVSDGPHQVAARPSVVVAFAGRDADVDAEAGAGSSTGALAALSRESGVQIVFGGTPCSAIPTTGLSEIDDTQADTLGIVGLVPAHCAHEVKAAAQFAHARGLALAIEVPADNGTTVDDRFKAVTHALDCVDAAGLSRERVMLVGAQRLLGDQLGIDEGRLERLLDLGAAICFDELGRIPTVRTVISDHDLAVAVLKCQGLGAGDRVMLSCGIAQKHRLTAFGGNGLEFVSSQFLPYLGMLGADEQLLAGVAGENALRLLERKVGA